MDVIFPALNHAPLAGTLSEPALGARGAVVIASALGVPRGFYGAFADHLAEGGLAVLRFDYRGIGGSRRGPLRECDATYHSWGEQDLAGALRFLRERHPSVPLLLVGHSVGGQLLGLLPEPGEVRAALTVAAQSGYWKLWSGLGRARLYFLWKVMFPALIRGLGYLPMSRLGGGGEDIPPLVAREWCELGLEPEHIRAYALRKDGARGYGSWRGRLRAIAMADDEWAPRAAVEKFVSYFPSADRELRLIDPISIGAGPIGHFGFFQRRFRETLWSEARAWLLEQAAAQRAA